MGAERPDAEIKSIVGIRRSGQTPCRHVHDVVRRNAADVEPAVGELSEVRKDGFAARSGGSASWLWSKIASRGEVMARRG